MPSTNTYTIGLTGGIGSGKSTVAQAFAKLGVVTVDADMAARKVVEPGMPSLASIAEHFGQHILQEDGALDRAALRKIIFKDNQEKLWLEKLLHPLIRQWIEEALQKAASPYVILESPLLLETDQHHLIDAVLVVDVPVETQLARAGLRDSNTKEQIQRIINTQMPRAERLSKADFVFDNSQPEESIDDRVLELHQQFLSEAEKKRMRKP